MNELVGISEKRTETEVMPLTKKGKKIKRAMVKEYGKKKGTRVFYAAKNKGTITGVEKRKPSK